MQQNTTLIIVPPQQRFAPGILSCYFYNRLLFNTSSSTLGSRYPGTQPGAPLLIVFRLSAYHPTRGPCLSDVYWFSRVRYSKFVPPSQGMDALDKHNRYVYPGILGSHNACPPNSPQHPLSYDARVLIAVPLENNLSLRSLYIHTYPKK